MGAINKIGIALGVAVTAGGTVVTLTGSPSHAPAPTAVYAPAPGEPAFPADGGADLCPGGTVVQLTHGRACFHFPASKADGGTR